MPALEALWSFLGSPQATTLSTIALLVVTATYVWLTGRIATAAILQAESVNRPMIVSNTEISSQGLITLILKNAGRSTAFDVKLGVDRDFFCFGEDRNLKEFPIFRENPFALGPGDAIRIALAMGHTLFRNPDRTPSSFNISATYRFGSTKYEETLPIDLTPYKDSTVPQSEFSIEMKKLREAIEKRP